MRVTGSLVNLYLVLELLTSLSRSLGLSLLGASPSSERQESF